LSTRNDDAIRLSESIKRFLEGYPDQTAFPLGKPVAIPTDAELTLLEAMAETVPALVGDLVSVRKNVKEVAHGYSLIQFAIRMAVLAVRRDNPDILITSLPGLILDDDKVDWRDILRALSIIENCAVRLGIEFRPAVENLCQFATPKRRHTIVEGYLVRSPDMRDVRVMGYAAQGEGRTLSFEPLEIG
jgi:hypothetical protein